MGVGMSGYGTNEGFASYLSSHGYILPSDAPSPDILRLIGSQYLDSAYEPRLQCSRRAGGFSQDRAWPREGHKVNRQEVPADLIPQAWVDASYYAAYLQATTEGGWATSGEDPNRIAKREKVDGAIEVEYFGRGDGYQGNAAMGFPVDPMIDGMVSVWLCPDGDQRAADSLFLVI